MRGRGQASLAVGGMWANCERLLSRAHGSLHVQCGSRAFGQAWLVEKKSHQDLWKRMERSCPGGVAKGISVKLGLNRKVQAVCSDAHPSFVQRSHSSYGEEGSALKGF